MKKNNAITLPPKTKARLAQLIAQREKLQAALTGTVQTIEEVVATAKEIMNVPDDWQIEDLEVGFVAFDPPPTAPGEETPQTN